MGRHAKLFVFFFLIFFIILAAFWPRPLSAVALTFRVPLYQWDRNHLGRGELLPLSTRVPLSTQTERNISPPKAVWFPFFGTSDLALVIPGLNGEATDDLNFLMAETFLNKGIPTAILPNATDWSFAIHRMSKDRRAQYTSSVEALCLAYEEIIQSPQVRRIYHEQSPRRVYLVGLSLGARYAIAMTKCSAFSSQSSGKKTELRVYAVNPPVDLQYAGQVLELLTKKFQDSRIESYSTGILLALLKPVVRVTKIDIGLRPLTLFSDSLSYIVGAYFSARMERIDTEQETPLTGLELRNKDFSFSKYMQSGPASLDGFLDEIDTAQKRTRGQLYLLHAKDDFLIRESDLDSVAQILKDKAIILKRGGHGGLIFEPVYKEVANRVLRETPVFMNVPGR